MLFAVRRWWPLVIITAVALWLRTHDLARRPMHADEANQAVKLGNLLDTGHYEFDPRDHHGPTLYYFAVPIAWLRGERSLATLSETTVRLVPALFGTAAVVLLALLAAPPALSKSNGLGRWPAVAAAAFFALAPPAVYYSRYFIQETLLVTFMLGACVCAREWWRRDSRGWAIATGACVGLMQATKASAPLFVVAAAGAATFVLARDRRQERTRVDSPTRPSPAPQRSARSGSWRRHAGFALGAALAVIVVFYSSFFTHLGGLHDAIRVYTQTGMRLTAGATGHEKPWWYYLQLLGAQREGGLRFHQVAFSALAVAGIVVAFVRRDLLLRAAVVYTLALLVVFSALAYKTPWHSVHFVPGLALLAGGTLAALNQLRTGKFVALAFAIVVAGTLYQQTALTSFLRPADQRNLFAYVHSSPDVLKLRALAETAIAAHPNESVRVISEEYWPLPWYFRGLPGVGYWTEPPADCDGALVITSPARSESVRARLRGTYRESFLGLRPGVLCVVFTRES